MPDFLIPKGSTGTNQRYSPSKRQRDTGHGGRDPGAIGTTGTLEKTITLVAAQELRRQLEATGRYLVALTPSLAESQFYETGACACPCNRPGSDRPNS